MRKQLHTAGQMSSHDRSGDLLIDSPRRLEKERSCGIFAEHSLRRTVKITVADQMPPFSTVPRLTRTAPPHKKGTARRSGVPARRAV